MIKINKTAAPAVLLANQAAWTAQAVAVRLRGESIGREERRKYRHDHIKNALLLESSNKCAYCECKLNTQYEHVEHIVPCNTVTNLMYAWTNLVVSCGPCNIEKGEYHDTAHPLIDPTTDEPSDDLFFFGEYVVELTPKGLLTWTELNLNEEKGIVIDRRGTLQIVEKFLRVMRRHQDNAVTFDEMRETLQQMKLPNSEYSKMVSDYLETTEFAASF